MTEVLSVAERYYNNHKERVCVFQRANPEKMRAKCKAYNERVKTERPDKYQEVLLQKRKYYQEVTKPKLEAKRKGAKPPSDPHLEGGVVGERSSP